MSAEQFNFGCYPNVSPIHRYGPVSIEDGQWVVYDYAEGKQVPGVAGDYPLAQAEAAALCRKAVIAAVEQDTSVPIPRWAWWALVLAAGFVFASIFALLQGNPVKAVVFIVCGLVVGCVPHGVLAYRESKVRR